MSVSISRTTMMSVREVPEKEPSEQHFDSPKNTVEESEEDHHTIFPLVLLKVNAIVKGYHECRFTATIQERFNVSKKRGERGNALRVFNGRGQLGHLQKELVGEFWEIIHKVIDW